MLHIPGVTPGNNVWGYDENEPQNVDLTFRTERSSQTTPGLTSSNPAGPSDATKRQPQKTDLTFGYPSDRSSQTTPGLEASPPTFSSVWHYDAGQPQHAPPDLAYHSDYTDSSETPSSSCYRVRTYSELERAYNELECAYSALHDREFNTSPSTYLTALSGYTGFFMVPPPLAPMLPDIPSDNFPPRDSTSPSSRSSSSSMDSDAIFSKPRYMEDFGRGCQNKTAVTGIYDIGEGRGNTVDDSHYNSIGNPGTTDDRHYGYPDQDDRHYGYPDQDDRHYGYPDQDDRLYGNPGTLQVYGNSGTLQDDRLYNGNSMKYMPLGDSLAPFPQPTPIMFQNFLQNYPPPGFAPRYPGMPPVPLFGETVPMFLDGIPFQPRPHHYTLYTNCSRNNTQHELHTIYIEGPDKDAVIYPDAKYFAVHVSSPSGNPCLVTLRLDSKVPCRYMCTFETPECGIYIATAQLWDAGFYELTDVAESPLKIPVSRDYYGATARTIVGVPRGRSVVRDRSRRVVKMWGMDVDKFSETIYVTSKESNLLQAWNSEGVKLAEIGENTQNAFFRPCGIAVDRPNKRIIVADKDNHRICFCTLDGKFITSFGMKGYKDGEFRYPWGVAVSPSGDLIAVTDSRNHRIQLFDKSGNFIRLYCAFQIDPYEYKSILDYPRGVCFDNEGKYIYVSDFNLHAILKFNTELTEMCTFVPPGRLCRPQGLTVDSAGNLIACDSRNDCCRVVIPDGDLLGTIHGKGVLDNPQNVAALRGDRILILDAKGSIRLF